MNPMVKTINPRLKNTMIRFGAKHSEIARAKRKRHAEIRLAVRSPERVTKTAPQKEQPK